MCPPYALYDEHGRPAKLLPDNVGPCVITAKERQKQGWKYISDAEAERIRESWLQGISDQATLDDVQSDLRDQKALDGNITR